MKFTLSWLKEYLDTSATLDQICDRLVMIGHEVEEIIDRAEIYKGFVVAHVVECDQHPNADRLKQCLVNTGKEQLQVVCGAPNVRKGLKVVFALPGTTIPSNGMVLKKTKIRDVESNGMICSESELKLSDESNGILELPENTPIGSDFATIMGLTDPVLDLAITPNRADALGVYGIARDLAASGLGLLKTIPQLPVPGGFDSPITVTIKDNKACPLYMGRYIRGVKNGPSPKWLQDYLLAIGSRPISALVDITNFICIGLNRPLHVFDADKLNGDIIVRLSKDGEKFTDLKEIERTLNDTTVVIADKSGIKAMGGVIGGLDSGCNNETTNIFLESAYFDPSTIRRAGAFYGIDSDAKYRFERGVDPAFVDDGVAIATRMILDFCGGEPSYMVVAGEEPKINRTIPFSTTKTKELGGLDVSVPEQMNILMKLGFDLRVREDDLLDIKSPSWRGDIEGQADLVEEILRIKGFDTIPPVSVYADHAVTSSALSIEQKRLSDLRRLCAVRGLQEAVTWSFLSDKAFKMFSYSDYKPTKIANAISSDLSVMRHSMLPNLIDAAKRNADRKMPNAALFEVGSIFYGVGPDQQPVMLAGIRTGSSITTWQDKAKKIDFFDIKADVWALLTQAGLNPDAITIARDAPRWYHPGQSGTLRLGKNIVAQFGMIHPGVLKDGDIDFPVAAFEIFTENLPAQKKKSATKGTLTLNPLQPVTRDFAFVASNDISAENIIKAAKNVDKNLITDVAIFDVYAGKGMAENTRSLAFTVSIQPTGASLTDADLEGLSKNIVAAVTKLGATLRT